MAFDATRGPIEPETPHSAGPCEESIALRGIVKRAIVVLPFLGFYICWFIAMAQHVVDAVLAHVSR